MRNFLNPKWLFIVNTLPVVVLFFIFYGEYQIIKSLLPDHSVQLWQCFGIALAFLGIANLAYAVYLTVRRLPVSVYYGASALLCHIVFIYLYGYYDHDIIPFSIPRWMIPGDMIIYVFTFLMPTLAYGLFVLVMHFTPQGKRHSAWTSFAIAVMVPIVWYLCSQIVLPLWQPVDDEFYMHAVIVFVIAGTLFFLFFLVRGLWILVTKKAQDWQRYQLAWKIPIAIVLPLIGLAVNNDHLFLGQSFGSSGVFGDFSNPWFYILAIVNGVLVCLPRLENKLYRLFVFMGRVATFAYTLYFFIVFLPFLPVSVIAIIVVGTGFLILTPLLLFVIHVNELSHDYMYLKSQFPVGMVIALSFVSALVIPISITLNYHHHRQTLHQALAYLYSPDYSKTYDIDKPSLEKTLVVVTKQKDSNRGGLFDNQQPYLSAYFNWLVLDNLTLTDYKINLIERVFFGEASFELRSENIRNSQVEITDVATTSDYDPSQEAWVSWVNLEISNHSNSNRFAEYATTFQLPEGAWINDYYLYVGDKKEMGILAEKKTAMWVFSNIRNENRDPGILYYLTGNRVAFRVFPFARDEVRKTGIALLHKEPITFTIDGHTVELGDPGLNHDTGFESTNTIYIPSKEKQGLKRVNRQPYFHFLVNATNKENMADYKLRIEKVIKKHPDLAKGARLSLVNTYVSTVEYPTDWASQLEHHSFEGGYYLDRGIKSAFYGAYKSNTGSYPVVVAVTDSIHQAIIDKDFADWQFTFPESALFYDLSKEGGLVSHSLVANPLVALKDTAEVTFENTVLEYSLSGQKKRYLPDNQRAGIVLKNAPFELSGQDSKEHDWSAALAMQAQWMSQTLHPETSSQGWLKLVRNSFLRKVMTPVTSFIVVENEAQKAILKKKQEQVLSGNQSLGLGEDAQRMSEPNTMIVFAFFVLLLLIKFWRSHKRSVE